IATMMSNPKRHDVQPGTRGQLVDELPEFRAAGGSYGVDKQGRNSRLTAGPESLQHSRKGAEISAMQLVIVSATLLLKRHRTGREQPRETQRHWTIENATFADLRTPRRFDHSDFSSGPSSQ